MLLAAAGIACKTCTEQLQCLQESTDRYTGVCSRTGRHVSRCGDCHLPCKLSDGDNRLYNASLAGPVLSLTHGNGSASAHGSGDFASSAASTAAPGGNWRHCRQTPSP